MEIFRDPLTAMIDQLETSIPDVDEGPNWGFAVERHDWRPVWALCQRIQNEFKGYKGFSTKKQQQEVWERFCQLRKRASHLADIEKEKFAEQSSRYMKNIMIEARAAYWSASADIFIGTFTGQTTVEEMKDLQHRLKNAGRMLSENKALMTRLDKEKCFEAIKEARESHDRFWQNHREHTRERREASQHRREEFERKRGEYIARVRDNLNSNRERLWKAETALERTRDRIRDLEGKLSETNSPKWENLFSEWLTEARSKERDIEDTVERIIGWISEDEAKLNGV